MTNLSPFYVGQKVVAVKDGRYLIKKGQTFTIEALHQHICGMWSVNVGHEDLTPGVPYVCNGCDKNYKSDGLHWCRSELFAPIQENFQSVSLEKILEEETKLISVN